VDSGDGRCYLTTSYSYCKPDWLPLVIARFRSLHHEHGTIYQRQYAQHCLLSFKRQIKHVHFLVVIPHIVFPTVMGKSQIESLA